MGVGPRETIHWPFGSTSGCNLVIYYCTEQKYKKGTRKKAKRESVLRLPFLPAVGQGHSAPICAKSSQAAVRHTYGYNYIYLYIYNFIYILYLFGFLLLLVPLSGLFICLLCSMQAAKEQIAGRDALIICIRSCHVLTACRRSHRLSR